MTLNECFVAVATTSTIHAQNAFRNEEVIRFCNDHKLLFAHVALSYNELSKMPVEKK